MDLGWESNDRTERKSCGDPRELAAEERWEREHPVVRPCECRDCMDLTYAKSGLCHSCEDAGCIKWSGECLAELWATEGKLP